MSQWRVLTYLRDYITRTTPIVSTFQRDLPDLVEKFVNSVQTSDKPASLTVAQKVENQDKTLCSDKADG